jgi:hypothetical protein
MTFIAQNCFRTVRGTALSGLLVGFAEALAYGLAFAVYAIARSSLQIGVVLAPSEGLWGTLAANAFSLLLAILVFTLLFGIGAAILEIVMLLLNYELLALLNPQHFSMRAAWIGLITSGILVVAILLFVQRSLGSYFDALWPSGFFFWLGLPSLIFIGVNSWLSWQFGNYRQADRGLRMLQKGELRIHAVH